MARDRYESDYDWRGIALLTQQLGQLFEPGKARVMAKEQQHEMNLLMAKKSWDIQTGELTKLRKEYEAVLEDIEAEKRKVEQLGNKDLVDAGLADGSVTDETLEVFEKNDISNLSKIIELSTSYEKIIAAKELDAFNYKLYNDHAIIGEQFGKTYKGPTGAKNYLEKYDTEPETPGFLSPTERENVKFAAINDMFLVEDITDKIKGKDYLTVYAAGKPVNIRPEGVAYIAGFDSVVSSPAEVRHGKAVTAKALHDKPARDQEILINEYLNLDASFMKLSDDDKTSVTNALRENSSIGLATGLKDTYLAMQERDKLSVQLQKAGLDERVQPLPDIMFEAVDKPGWFTGETQKPWTQYEDNGQTRAGLTKEVYDDIRSMGSKANMVRRDFEYIVNNWDGLTEEARTSGIQLVYSQYNKIKADMLKGL